ncbi:hypothetical protein LTR91_023157 [Friedmanniomyces endolithicus]|uniref:Zn(2)-C6 fungal-type domain-containing protein n=1 Tax=Friedmanniomyces endolithicus TaxID=329885 RepID=A0AAN6JY36_9PEZI|nr:hypothetical protein LTR75_017236 [Friedmanniomyces endolithicus]KAK0856135.1 hypothetical protein LTR03_001543 [Friedmanniomyces endolithicus]KAK0856698.1 hypothetical protein LTS02_010516 [Friedmanniomyces endolithicus]KAK0880637.1 hypothetical protein LTR87_005601 [Friedmanniomyces endolithicus]KAK0890410.1 hypothetical protein LTR02_014724 [Friedmanniomyces endolithicus]
MPPRQRCEACHTSQKACDKKRPKCGRCTARATECEYQPTLGHLFVDQNAFSAGLSHRASRRTRNSPASAVLLDVSQLLLTEMQGRAVDSPEAALIRLHSLGHSRIAAPPADTLHDRVLGRFLSRWTAGSTCLGCQDFVVEIYEASAPDGAMRSAIEATAYADLVVADRHGDLASKSFRAYLTTLGRIQRQLRYFETASDLGAGVRQAVLAAILVLDSYELLYIRRPTPLGIHTRAIIRLVELESQGHALGEPRGIALARFAARRVQARQLLYVRESLLGASHRTATHLAENPLDIRILRFVADACDAMRVLEVEQTKWMRRDAGTSDPPEAGVLLTLLRGMEDWLEKCNTTTLPRPTRVPLHIPSALKWPLPRTAMATTILIYSQDWMARAWTLIHMCYVRISETLLGLQPPDEAVHRNDEHDGGGMVVGPGATKLRLRARLDTSSRLLLDLTPFLMGLTDENGSASMTPTPVLQDSGLLIVQYPLWMLLQARFVAPAAKTEAAVLLSFIDEQRRVVGR